MTTTFRGFSPEGMDFLRGLEEDNSKRYFDEHRDVYRSELFEPSKRFVEAMGDELKLRVSPAIRAEPKANGSIGRINRDIRFNPDAPPYNTDLRFHFWEGGTRNGSPGLYLAVGPGGVGFGSGLYQLDREKLAAYREAVADEQAGQELVDAIEQTRRATKAELSEPKYKRVPKPWDDDHPRADLLRYAGLYVWRREDLPRSASSARFVSWCANRLEKLAPVHRWYVQHLGPWV